MIEENQNTELEKWENLAKVGKFQELVEKTKPYYLSNPSACFFYTNSLRALDKGNEANLALRERFGVLSFQENPEEIVSLGEELLQCSYFEEASLIANQLRRRKFPGGVYLAIILAREFLDWPKVELLCRELEKSGGRWKKLATIQRVLSVIKQGKAITAEKFISSIQSQDPSLQKLKARFYLSTKEWEKAEATLNNVALMQPDDWEWPGLLAVALFGKSKNIQADKTRINQLFDQSLRKQPRQPQLLYNYYQILALSGSVHTSYLEQALLLKPWWNEPLFALVEYHIRDRRYIEAVQILESQIKIHRDYRREVALLEAKFLAKMDPSIIRAALGGLKKVKIEDPTVLRTMGVLYQKLNEYDLAQLYYEKALDIDSDDLASVNNIAVLYGYRGDYPAAVSRLREIYQISTTEVKSNYIKFCIRNGDLIDAEEAIASLRPEEIKDEEIVKLQAELALKNEDIEHAEVLTKKAWEINKHSLINIKHYSAMIALKENKSEALKFLVGAQAQCEDLKGLRKLIFPLLRELENPQKFCETTIQWTRGSSKDAEYFMMAADAAEFIGDFTTARNLLNEAYSLKPEVALDKLSKFLDRRAELCEMIELCKTHTKKFPDQAIAWGLLGEAHFKNGNYKKALKKIDQGLVRLPLRYGLIRQKIGLLLSQQKISAAILEVDQFYKQTKSIEGLQLFISINEREGHLKKVLEEVYRLLETDESSVILIRTAAQIEHKMGNYERSELLWDKLEAIAPRNFKIMMARAKVLFKQNRLSDLINRISRFKQSATFTAPLYVVLIQALREHGELTEAKDYIDEALTIFPRYLPLLIEKAKIAKHYSNKEEEEVWLEIMANFGISRWFSIGLNRIVDLNLEKILLDSINKLLEPSPDSLTPLWMAYEASKALNRPKIAEMHLDKISKVNPFNLRASIEKIDILSDDWRLSDAIQQAQKALKIWPTSVELISRMINCFAKAGDFSVMESHFSTLDRLLGDQRYSTYQSFFFNINCHPSWSAKKIYSFYSLWYQRTISHPEVIEEPFRLDITENKKLRIGYVSADFTNHAVAFFSEPLLKGHCRDNVELVAYSNLEPKDSTPKTEIFRSYFDEWNEVANEEDMALWKKIRNDKIDILVDLSGHTRGNRLNVFTKRAAPIQLSWIWGAGQTTGIREIDYFACDCVSVPPSHEEFMAEKVARKISPGYPYLPPPSSPAPKELPYLRNGYITFGVLARPIRVNNLVINVWSKILKEVKFSKIRFDHAPYVEPDVQKRIIDAFNNCGVSEDRLIFANTRPHWNVYHDIDIQLDPFPAGSGTTATEGLYMERVVITLKARPPMGLIVHSQLVALGLDSYCSADSKDDYVAKAIELSGDKQKLHTLSKNLRSKFMNSLLMDYSKYGTEVMSLYRDMWSKYCVSQKSKT